MLRRLCKSCKDQTETAWLGVSFLTNTPTWSIVVSQKGWMHIRYDTLLFWYTYCGLWVGSQKCAGWCRPEASGANKMQEPNKVIPAQRSQCLSYLGPFCWQFNRFTYSESLRDVSQWLQCLTYWSYWRRALRSKQGVQYHPAGLMFSLVHGWQITTPSTPLM